MKFNWWFLKSELISWKFWLTTQGEIHNGCKISMFFIPDSVQSWAERCRCGTRRWPGWWLWRRGGPRSCSSPPTETPKSANNDGKNSLRTSKWVRAPPWVLNKLVSPITGLQLALLMLHVKSKTCKVLPDTSCMHLQTAESQCSPAGRRRCPSSPGCLPASCSVYALASCGRPGVRRGSRSATCMTHLARRHFKRIRINPFSLPPRYLHKPGVVQSVPELQNLFLYHSCVVHLVAQHLVELYTTQENI